MGLWPCSMGLRPYSMGLWPAAWDLWPCSMGIWPCSMGLWPCSIIVLGHIQMDQQLSINGLSYEVITPHVEYSSEISQRYGCFESMFVGTSHLRFGVGPMVSDNGGTRLLTAPGRIGDEWDAAKIARFRAKVSGWLGVTVPHERGPETVGWLMRGSTSARRAIVNWAAFSGDLKEAVPMIRNRAWYV